MEPRSYTFEYAPDEAILSRAKRVFKRDLVSRMDRAFPLAALGLGIATLTGGFAWFMAADLELDPLLTRLAMGTTVLFGLLLTLVVTLQGAVHLLLKLTFFRGDRQYRAALAEQPTVRWTLLEDRFETRWTTTRSVRWNEVDRFRTGAEFWLIGVERGPELFLPAALLSEPARSFVREKIGRLEKPLTA